MEPAGASSPQLHPDPATQAVIRQQIFEHADWHEFDRGTLSEAAAIEHFAKHVGAARPTRRAR